MTLKFLTFGRMFFRQVASLFHIINNNYTTSIRLNIPKAAVTPW